MKTKTPLAIRELQGGGLVVNYQCSSRCRHCLYASSPHWPKDYCTPEQAEKNLRIVKKLGTLSVHVGGGEPLLSREGILGVLAAARKAGVAVEYIETNASWQVDDEKTLRLLEELQEHGVETLLISMSPYHNEFIPFSKVEKLMKLCERAGMGVFPWVERFRAPLSRKDTDRTHAMDDEDLLETLRSYPLNLRGRALVTYRRFMRPKPLDEILGEGPCGELSSTAHFHVDLFGGYIPGLCSGFSIAVEDLGVELDPKRYPLLSRLHEAGVEALVARARESGFQAAEQYVSKCDLCLEVRRHLVKQRDVPRELKPEAYYREL